MVRYGMEDGVDDEEHVRETLKSLGANNIQAEVLATHDESISVGTKSDDYAVKVGEETYDSIGNAARDVYDFDEAERQAGVTRNRESGDPISDGGYDEPRGREDERVALGELKSDAAWDIYESMKE